MKNQKLRNLLALNPFLSTKIYSNSMSCVTLHNTEYDCFMLLDGNNEFDLSKNRSCHDFEFFEKQQVAISCRRV